MDELKAVGAIPFAFSLQRAQLVDSQLEATRVFWRKKFCGASDVEANDPRPWETVAAERLGAGGSVGRNFALHAGA